MKLIKWLKGLFVAEPCQHNWVEMGVHTNHPAFDHKGVVAFLKCLGKCDGRHIELR